MLKERKLLRYENTWMIGNTLYERGEKNVIGWYTFDSWLGGLSVCIKDDNSKNHISGEDYCFTEFESEASESDYHSYSQTYHFKGVYLAFDLNTQHFDEESFNQNEFLEVVENILSNHNLIEKFDCHESTISERGYLQVVLLNKMLNEKTLLCAEDILKFIREYETRNGIIVAPLNQQETFEENTSKEIVEENSQEFENKKVYYIMK